jgi:hypothetical protein
VGHFEEGDGDLGIVERSVGIEERRDIDGGDHDDDDLEGDERDTAPDVPGVRKLADDRVEGCDDDAAEDEADQSADCLVTRPPGEGLVGLVVDVLAVEAGIDVQGETGDGGDDEEFGEVDPGLQPLEAGEANGEVAHAAGGAGEEQEQHDDNGVDGVPEQEPVATFEVFVGGGALVWGDGVEIGAGGGVDVEVAGGVKLGGGWDGAELYDRLRCGSLCLCECCWR